MDRNKVVKGLEICSRVQDNEICPDDCPYRKDICYGTAGLMADALALLKEQEPRVLTLEEVKAAKGTDLFLEISGYPDPDTKPYITAATLDGVGKAGVSFYCNVFEFDTYNKSSYGWRCWNVRPTEEQRGATPWQS